MNIFHFTVAGKKTFEKLPKDIQERITNKLITIKDHPNIFSVLTALENYNVATHRLRVGNYRVVLGLLSESKTGIRFQILEVGHRKDIYR